MAKYRGFHIQYKGKTGRTVGFYIKPNQFHLAYFYNRNYVLLMGKGKKSKTIPLDRLVNITREALVAFIRLTIPENIYMKGEHYDR